MDQKRLFVQDYIRGSLSMSEPCARYHVSRKTGYKWLGRFEEEGREGLSDRSRRPHGSPRATPADRVEAILALRRRHPFWGAKKLRSVLERRHPRVAWPARSTVCERRRRSLSHPS